MNKKWECLEADEEKVVKIAEEYNISSFDELDIYIKDGNIVIKKRKK